MKSYYARHNHPHLVISITLPNESPHTGRWFGRRLWLFLFAVCAVPALLGVLQAYMQARLRGESAKWQDLVFEGGEWLFLGALLPITYYLGKRYPLRRARWKRSLGVHLVGALGLCIGWASLGLVLGALLQRFPATGDFPRDYLSWILTTIPWSVFMYFAVLGCVYAFSYFAEAREREAHAARLTAQLAEARLGALRMQLHPHFLFNSLNAVAVLVRDGRTADATHVVEQLSEMLRELLSEQDVRDVTLAREIAFVEKYLAIEQVRFSDRLAVRWRISPTTLDALVPSFILQPLVENALRHGVAARTGRSTIEIAADVEGAELRLTISNDAPDASARDRTRGRGVGLTSTRERLATLFGGRAQLSLTESEGRVRAEVRVPFRRAATNELPA